MSGDGSTIRGSGSAAADQLPGPRRALIIATGTYEDPGLQQLRTPGRDAERLAAALSDPAIGDFSVLTMIDQPWVHVAIKIAGFFGEAGGDDVLLLYMACHGVKSETGELHFAARNTRMDRLAATTVSAQFVNDQMSRSRSRRIVLLLDCCYSGAFEHGLIARSGGDLGLAERLRGQGRAVITASSAIEYAFENNELKDSSGEQESVFTGALVRALETGEADRDQDGLVSLEELYDFTHEDVKRQARRQTPSKWEFGLQGTLYIARRPTPVYIARRPTPVTVAAPLPPEMEAALAHPLPVVRASVVPHLQTMARGRHQGQALAARKALKSLLEDDSVSVRRAAAAALRLDRATTALPPVTTYRSPAKSLRLGASRGPASMRLPGWRPQRQPTSAASASAQGALVFNPPEEMLQGRMERVEVAVARSAELVNLLRNELRGRGSAIVEPIRTSSLMEVTLTGESFEIAELSPKEQLVAPTARWEFDVRPRLAGMHRLLLRATMRVDIPDHPGVRIAIPVYETVIRVRVDIRFGTRQFIKANWQWLIATALALGGGVISAWATLFR